MKAELERVAARERLQMEQLMVSAPPSSRDLGGKTHQQFTLLLTKYKDLERQLQETKAQLDEATHSLALYRDLEGRYEELEQAHLVQAAHVQRLQREKTQVAELKVSALSCIRMDRV